jgi:hypothetical protein
MSHVAKSDAALEWAFRAMRMLGREAIIVDQFAMQKSRAFMAIVGRSPGYAS